MSENHSEVAHLLRQIRLEYEAAQQGLNGLAQGTSQHQVITARMNRVGDYCEKLATLVGEAEATRTIGELYTRTMEGEATPALQEPCP